MSASATKATAQERKRRKSRLFSHPQDVHCAIYNVVNQLCYVAAFWLWLNPEMAGLTSVGSKIAFCLGAGFLLGWISGVNVGVNFHNHAHRPIFHSEFLNRWFGRFWTFSGGWPAFYWYHSHVVVHHSNLLLENDWTMPKRRADGRFESIYKYVFFHWPWRYIPHLWKDFTTGRGGDWVPKKAAKEGLIFLAIWSIPFFIDPIMAIGLWLFPQWIANGVIMGSGMYVQHAGTVPKSEEFPVNHSNSFQSKFFNLTMFNIGYHIVHHDYEQVHWSVLPNFHRRMKNRLIENGGHVVQYGYYHAAHIVSAPFSGEGGFNKFVTDQAEGYERTPESIPTAALGTAVLNGSASTNGKAVEAEEPAARNAG